MTTKDHGFNKKYRYLRYLHTIKMCNCIFIHSFSRKRCWCQWHDHEVSTSTHHACFLMKLSLSVESKCDHFDIDTSLQFMYNVVNEQVCSIVQHFQEYTMSSPLLWKTKVDKKRRTLHLERGCVPSLDLSLTFPGFFLCQLVPSQGQKGPLSQLSRKKWRAVQLSEKAVACQSKGGKCSRLKVHSREVNVHRWTRKNKHRSSKSLSDQISPTLVFHCVHISKSCVSERM